MKDAGFALIELMVALVIFAIVATGLAQTLAAAQRARWTSERWMQATQLAEERLERVRAGDLVEATIEVDGFRVSSRGEPAPGYDGLRLVTIAVVWPDRGEQTFVLRSLLGARP